MSQALKDFRTANPAYNEWTDTELADGLYDKYYAKDMDKGEYLSKLGMQPAIPERTWGEAAKDTGISIGQSALALGNAAAGLGAMANVPYAADAVEGYGLASKRLDGMKSAKIQAQTKGLEAIDTGSEVDDFGKSVMYLADNPALLADMGAQSVSLLAGGLVTSLATKVSPQ